MAETNIVQTQVEAEAGKRMGAEGADRNRNRVAAAELRRRMQGESANAALRYGAEGRKGASDGQKADILSQFKKGRRDQIADTIDGHNDILRGGYDAMDPADQGVWRAHIKSSLDGSTMGELFRGTTDPDEVKAMTEGLLQDPQFMLVYQDRLTEITESKAHLSVTDEKVQDRARLLAASEPKKYADPAAAESDARKALYKEWQDTTEDNLQNVVGTSINRYMTQKLETARDASGDINSLMVKDTIARKEQEWHQPGKVGKEAVKQSFESFMQGGGEQVLGAETWGSMSDDEREEFNKKFGEKLMTERMLTGQFKKDDLRLLGNAEWLGEDFSARVDKIQEMFQANNQFKRLIAEGQANGTIDKNVWDKIKAAGPGIGIGALAALLGYLLLPLAPVVGTVITASGAVGGGLVGRKLQEDI